jgi:hypothetical protein
MILVLQGENPNIRFIESSSFAWPFQAGEKIFQILVQPFAILKVFLDKGETNGAPPCWRA